MSDHPSKSTTSMEMDSEKKDVDITENITLTADIPLPTFKEEMEVDEQIEVHSEKVDGNREEENRSEKRKKVLTVQKEVVRPNIEGLKREKKSEENTQTADIPLPTFKEEMEVDEQIEVHSEKMDGNREEENRSEKRKKVLTVKKEVVRPNIEDLKREKKSEENTQTADIPLPTFKEEMEVDEQIEVHSEKVDGNREEENRSEKRKKVLTVQKEVVRPLKIEDLKREKKSEENTVKKEAVRPEIIELSCEEFRQRLRNRFKMLTRKRKAIATRKRKAIAKCNRQA